MSTKEVSQKIAAYMATQPVTKAWLFGSYARGEQREDSDVDIIITLDSDAHVGLFKLSGMQLDLQDILHLQIDLVTEKGLLPFAKESADQDKILIYERAMKQKTCIRIFALVCFLLFLFANAYSQNNDSTAPDTLCRLISFSDTIYITDMDAHYTIDRYRSDCWGNSGKKLDHPLYILHIKGPLCGKLSTLVCQSADYYDRGNCRWIPMKRQKAVGSPSVDVTLESSDCQLLFQFEK
jgi:predicted nucleotidyltransferase